MIATPLNLGPGRSAILALGPKPGLGGYFSKPPLIAWTIWLTTSLFGDSEWATRLAAPFLHTAAAAILFRLGRSMYSPRVGMLAALIYILMPGVYPLLIDRSSRPTTASSCPSGHWRCWPSGSFAKAGAGRALLSLGYPSALVCWPNMRRSIS